MQLNSRFSGQEAETYPAQAFFDSRDMVVESSPFTQLRAHVFEYGRLLLTFLNLYVQGRILMARNYVLSCKLRMWDTVFLYFKVQIFLTRLVRGMPVGECWPRK
jgi:hypothetical protein